MITLIETSIKDFKEDNILTEERSILSESILDSKKIDMYVNTKSTILWRVYYIN
jgi:hypothetical protein